MRSESRALGKPSSLIGLLIVDNNCLILIGTAEHAPIVSCGRTVCVALTCVCMCMYGMCMYGVCKCHK